MTEVLANTMVVIVLQYIIVFNQLIVYLQFAYCDMSIYLNNAKIKKKKKRQINLENFIDSNHLRMKVLYHHNVILKTRTTTENAHDSVRFTL